MMEFFIEPQRMALQEIFARLADYMHSQRIKQIVAAGPSAQPYAAALGLAFEKRHRRKVKVYALGELGEKLPASEKPKEDLKKYRPTMRHNKRTLLLEDVIETGIKLRNLSRAFKAAGIPHKTAAIIAHPLMNPVVDCLGTKRFDSNSFFPMRGTKLVNARAKNKPPSKIRYELELLRSMRRELNEVAKSIPRKR